MDNYICHAYEPTEEMKQVSIGYTNKLSIFIVISSITIILNFMTIAMYFKNNLKQKRSAVSMSRMILILTISDTFIAVYWLLSEAVFGDSQMIYDNCMGCFYLSLFGIFAYSYTWCYLTFSLSNLKVMITHPIKGILKPDVRLIFYILFSFFIAIMVTLFSYLIEVYGISPMITCFIRTEFINQQKKIKLIFFNCLPFLSILYSYYLLIFVLGKSRIRKNKHLLSPFMKYIFNVSIFYILNTPMFILLIVTSFDVKIEKGKLSGWISFLCCLLSIFSGFIFAIIRFYQNYSKSISSLIKLICCRMKIFYKDNNLKLLHDINQLDANREANFGNNTINKTNSIKPSLNNIDNPSINPANERVDCANDFFNLEKEILENFSRDIFIGICHSLRNSKIKKQKNSKKVSMKFYKKLLKKDCLETLDFSIIKNNINFKDEEINKAEHIEFDLIEYAPKIFKILRELDGIDDEAIIESLRPSKNKFSIKKSQGKGGSFFITTDDNRYLMKTINADELELIRGIFLKKFVKHIRRYPDSLICRIYGIYRMIMADGNDVVVLLMRNIIGPMQENIICKYDLKGSTLNRETNLDIDNLGKIVMKDNNFIDIEHYVFMNKSEINRLRQNTMSDGYFLNDMELMDYSLFLVKIFLTQRELKEIFGDEEINNYCEKNRNTNNIYQRKSSLNIYVDTEESNFIETENNTENNNLNQTNVQSRNSISTKNNINNNNYPNIKICNAACNNENEINIEQEKEIETITLGNNKIHKNSITLNKLGMTVNEIKSYRKYMYRSVYENIVYLVSIIDYFQIYNFFKYLETNYKYLFSSKDKYGISCVPPHKYLKRFIEYINKITDMERASQEGLTMNLSENKDTQDNKNNQ